jgi:hypothetical protein
LRRYLDDNQNRPSGQDGSGNKLKFVNGERRRFLEGREMTARHTMEALSLLDVLPFKLYTALRRCATARNEWLHAQTEPSGQDAILAIRSLGELFELVEGVPLGCDEV